MCNLKVILLIFILCIIGYNIYIKNTYTDNFKNQNIKLILFYTNWCKFSRKLLPIWNKVVKDCAVDRVLRGDWLAGSLRRGTPSEKKL